jgi:hypothetical protein
MRPGLPVGQVEGSTAETLTGIPEDCWLEITHQIFYTSGALLHSANQVVGYEIFSIICGNLKVYQTWGSRNDMGKVNTRSIHYAEEWKSLFLSPAIYLFLSVMEAQISCHQPHIYNIHHSLQMKVLVKDVNCE